MAHVEQAGLETCSGCGCLLVLGMIGLGTTIVRGLSLSAANPHRPRLISLMTEFVVGADRSQTTVEEIRSLLSSRFASDPAYADVTTAVGSFVPGGAAPFYDEARLAEALREFLQGQHISVPEAPQDIEGVWPPPPRVNPPPRND